MVTCTSCGAENRDGQKFCTTCGAPLSAACPTCGAAYEPGQRFCGECGTALVAAETAVAAAAPNVERRVVTILFADLVGFTALSESRDAEDVRGLLTRYFDIARVIDTAGDAAARLGNEAKLLEILALVAGMPPGHRTPEMDWVAPLVRARLAVARSEDAEADFREAAGVMRTLGYPFYVARVLVEHGEWLVSIGKHAEAEPLLEEAEALLQPLRATVWLERIERARAGAGAAVA